MVPLDDYYPVNSPNSNTLDLCNSGVDYNNCFVAVDTQQNQRVLAQKALTDYLEGMKTKLTNEEFRKLMVWAYQGCDLRYQRTCDYTIQNGHI